MKYISIDIETTGLDPEKHQILSVAAIIENTEEKLPFDTIPKFNVAIKHKEVVGSLAAMNINADLINTIAHYQATESQDEKNDLVNITGMQFLDENNVAEAFFDFLFINNMCDFDPANFPIKYVNGKTIPVLTSSTKPTLITVAGKNFASFDKRFLERLPRWQQAIRIRQRILDPAVLYIDWEKDKTLPNLNTCKQRAGIAGDVTHTALEDAWDVIQILRKFY